MASTSSSSSVPNTIHHKYDVFLSFRGEDTRHTFTDHLYEALMRVGLRTFRDNDAIDRGQELKPELEKAILESRASIIVLSKNYADSRWCLNELVLILEQRRKSNHFVLPVFYHVDPSDVRNQRHSFAIESDPKWREVNDVNRWKSALTEVAGLTGMVESGVPNQCVKFTKYKDALTIAIPNLDGDDYTTENMRVEYEWKPPRCSHCCVFGHQYDLCPKQVRLPIHKDVDEDGFTQVKTRRKGAAVLGYKLNKPKTKLVYRPKQPASKPIGDNSFADKGKEVQGAALVKTGPSIVNNNPFNVLANMGEHGDTNTSTSGAQYATDSDDDEVIFDEAAHAFVDSVLSEGASTPGKTGLNG